MGEAHMNEDSRVRVRFENALDIPSLCRFAPRNLLLLRRALLQAGQILVRGEDVARRTRTPQQRAEHGLCRIKSVREARPGPLLLNPGQERLRCVDGEAVLAQPQREINLRVRLDEYLRFGLRAGILYAT